MFAVGLLIHYGLFSVQVGLLLRGHRQGQSVQCGSASTPVPSVGVQRVWRVPRDRRLGAW
jgi:hypothetical protein